MSPPADGARRRWVVETRDRLGLADRTELNFRGAAMVVAERRIAALTRDDAGGWEVRVLCQEGRRSRVAARWRARGARRRIAPAGARRPRGWEDAGPVSAR
jgi:hypothetical protein